MRLRGRAVFLLAIANTAVFGVLGALVLDDVRNTAKRERNASVSVAKELTPLLAPILNDALRSEDPADSGFDLERILTWPHWSRMRDAVLVDRTIPIGDGSVLASGLCVNPLGVAHRSLDFDFEKVKLAISQAMKEKSVIEDPQGVAVPVMADGELRGGAYFLFREARNVEWSPIGLLITFIASTVLLTGAVGYLISTSVVKPVEHLADVSWRIAHGDLAAEPRPDANDDEIGNLTQSTVAMLQTLRAHRRDLEIACDEAAERAKKAERELLRTQRLASMGTLAAGIAHEINNPLGGLLNAVRVLREGKLPPDRREEYYELVLEGLERIQGIVGRVLTMAPRTGVHSEVALAEAARDAAALAEHRARKLGITIDTEFTENGGTILGNRGELVQVFLNIILNSIDSIEERQHSEPGYEGGSIRIAVRETGNEVVATVRDTGNGLDSAIAERVFDPFFTTKEQSKGSGLGLAVVFGIVQNHRGTVLLRPATTQPADGERGCEVVMRFPRSNVLA